MSHIRVDKDLCYLTMLSVAKITQRRRCRMSVEHWWNEAEGENQVLG
jgi:hypothetical protein